MRDERGRNFMVTLALTMFDPELAAPATGYRLLPLISLTGKAITHP